MMGASTLVGLLRMSTVIRYDCLLVLFVLCVVGVGMDFSSFLQTRHFVWYAAQQQQRHSSGTAASAAGNQQSVGTDTTVV